ncbi:MAG: hypothetical protein HC805_05480 [Alkalinema sp. RL_2_19]|nr:hypothetical protein [Alkalinema sp. RL_2_19]
MRPDIPQKSGTNPSNLEDRSPLVDNRESVTSEVSRPSCNAAAMLGIAISVGVGSFAAPVFHGTAQATETVPTQVSVESPVVVEPITAMPVGQPIAVLPQSNQNPWLQRSLYRNRQWLSRWFSPSRPKHLFNRSLAIQ